jgi:phospholipid/cholesterol/gamma-HCH transport system permease protein
MFITFLGKILHAFYVTLLGQQKCYWPVIWGQVGQVGLNAIPIVMMLNFLVGIVLTHQGIDTLKEYGQIDKIPNVIAPIYVRYVGALITSLLVAGRSGSAFTSEIGSMILNQEIDAISVIGINPIGMIVIPRIIATAIMLPMLVILSIVAGLLGSIFFAGYLVDYSSITFLNTVQDLIKLQTVFLTVLKSFIFGLIIGTIGCFRGFCVFSNAQVLGSMTTQSVVECIFWTIVFDGGISTYYSFLEL